MPASCSRAATSNGMSALGWEAGGLATGQLADFVTVRLDTRRTAGSDPSLAATAVFAATAADVEVVVVGGRPVVVGQAPAPRLSPDVAPRELSGRPITSRPGPQ